MECDGGSELRIADYEFVVFGAIFLKFWKGKFFQGYSVYRILISRRGGEGGGGRRGFEDIS